MTGARLPAMFAAAPPEVATIRLPSGATRPVRFRGGVLARHGHAGIDLGV
jgi:hypothetical protein